MKNEVFIYNISVFVTFATPGTWIPEGLQSPSTTDQPVKAGLVDHCK
jgi:hypothetical protein